MKRKQLADIMLSEYGEDVLAKIDEDADARKVRGTYFVYAGSRNEGIGSIQLSAFT